MPPKLVLEKLPGQCDGIVAANPSFFPTKKFPKEFSEDDKKRLTDEMTKAINDDVIPAYKKFTEFLRTEYDPKGRTEISVETLPDGKRRYAEAVKMMTTMNVTPAEVHEIGLKEVERITAEMTKLAKAQGKKDLASFREAINNDPKWKPKSEQQIVDDFEKYIDQMEPKLPELFGLLPKAPVTVEPSRLREGRGDALRRRHARRETAGSCSRCCVRPGQAHAGHWTKPSPITKAFRGITCRSASPRLCRIFRIPVPRLLLGLRRRLGAVFRGARQRNRLLQGSRLRLRPTELELFRAVRLVVDTGIHDKNWSREKVSSTCTLTTERRRGADRGRPLHRLARPGVGLYKSVDLRQVRERPCISDKLFVSTG